MEVGPASAMGQDVFLKLLTTQLEFQDPLEPVGGTEFVTQLAQFSQLEQTTGVNDRLDKIVQGNASLNSYGATGLIGKEVQVSNGVVVLSKGTQPLLHFSLEGAAEKVALRISNDKGEVVRTLELGQTFGGLQSSRWDGRDANGLLLPNGEYHFDVTASGVNGNEIESGLLSAGLVTGVVYEEGAPFLIVNGEKVPGTSVVAVKNP